MNIIELYQNLERETVETVLQRRSDGGWQPTQIHIVVEHLLEVYVNEVLTMKLTCTPDALAELVLGRLLSEGLIQSAADVETLYICEHGLRARVFLRKFDKHEAEQPYVEQTPSCCTGNRTLNDYFVSDAPLRPLTPIPWQAAWIEALGREMRGDTPVHRRTNGTHSCFLAREGELLYTAEDIGRHNALDKVIGWALRHGVDLTQCMIYSSGRIPTDMSIKAIRARIPILVSKEAPTQEALVLAKEYRLTLIGMKKDGSMMIYRQPEGKATP